MPQAADANNNRQQPLAFLPNLCSVQAVFLLVLLGELLALALSLASDPQLRIHWGNLGTHSMLIQWVVLLSAALLCPLRFWLYTQPGWLAGTLCYLLVLAVTLVCSLLGQWAMAQWQAPNLLVVANNLLLAAIFAGIVLRYLYVQQQWHNQQQAELQARIQALHSRIQPHFLFNSMNSIASLIATAPDKAERLVEDLSCLFRASLAEPGLVSLEEELELCQQFMDIEQTRLGERLRTHWRLPDPALQRAASIPCLLLQPLLENAIVHGISGRTEGGDVHVEVQIEGERVKIAIRNPLAAAVNPRNGNRMALDNIRNRLAVYFGNAAHLDTREVEGEFCVCLEYPGARRQIRPAVKPELSGVSE
ncbi:sensor histidine kinase [Pseudomaricurvus sp. HS19]|uniref:sensor histidine kinase n=1 Tax=Pseudomaricurvus sp. HS19 TaxID=2692626 RepID=UPI00136ACA01|nr:histidine kinase [Pseudomaricurvus sp. HS19]MYM63864.1 transcriptional regulator [Pseudomaricurvus sp. HS19]